jgi:uncharacterized protein YjiS (DUF1127 family)
MAGCAAYAEALYPIPPALEPERPLPVAMAPHAASSGLSAAMPSLIPSLSLIHSKDDFVKRELQLRAGLPAHTAALAFVRSGQRRPASLPWHIWLGLFIIAGWSKIQKAQERRRAIAELRGLDDRALRDIGLSHGEIEYVIRHGARRE